MEQINAPKVRWYKRSRAWRRLLSDLAALAVGLNAAVISWTHIVRVSADLHQGELQAFLYPVSIDGMMIVGVVKAADDRADGRKVRPWARVATWLGGSISVTAQVLSAWPYGHMARVWATIPAGTLIVVVEVLARRGKLQAQKDEAAQAADEHQTQAASSVEAPVDSLTSVPTPEAPTPVTVAVEPTVEPSNDVDTVEGIIEETPKPRRKARRVGHPGTGASDEVIEAARMALTSAASTAASNDTIPAFVEPS